MPDCYGRVAQRPARFFFARHISAARVSSGSCHFISAIIRASLGEIFTVPTFSTTTAAALAWLRNHNFHIFAERVDGSIEYTAADFSDCSAIALGSEAHGLTAAWHAPDVIAVRVPLLGSVDSLNLSATAAIFFYEALRQRRSA